MELGEEGKEGEEGVWKVSGSGRGGCGEREGVMEGVVGVVVT